MLIIKIDKNKRLLILLIFWNIKWHSSLKYFSLQELAVLNTLKTTEHNKNQKVESSTPNV